MPRPWSQAGAHKAPAAGQEVAPAPAATHPCMRHIMAGSRLALSQGIRYEQTQSMYIPASKLSSLPHIAIWLGDVAINQILDLKVLHEGGMVETETVLRWQKR